MAYSTTTLVYNKCGISDSDVSTAIVTQYIADADAFIESKLSKTWATPSAKTSYFDTEENDWHKNPTYYGGRITGQKPFFESRANFNLEWSPVTKISNVWLLNKSAKPNKVLSYDVSEATYTDNTDGANSVGEDLFYTFASTVGVGDILYVGCQYKFLSIYFNLATEGSGGVCSWKYYNGSSWADLTVTEDTTGADDLNASGGITWGRPADWETTSVNSSDDLYFIKITVTTAHTTSPKAEYIYFNHDSIIEKEFSPHEYTWYSDGRLIMRNYTFDSDAKSLRVDYYAGASSTPTLVQNLSTVLASISCMQYLMGGSFDDASGYSLGSLQVQKGEPYTNLRATIVELIKERDELYRQLGIEVTLIST